MSASENTHRRYVIVEGLVVVALVIILVVGILFIAVVRNMPEPKFN